MHWFPSLVKEGQGVVIAGHQPTRRTRGFMTTRSCPLCANPSPRVFFERRNVPVHQNRPCLSAEEARRFTRGDLRLAFCEECGFVSNTAFEPGILQYSSEYENTQTCSPCFKQYLTGLGESLIAKYGLKDKLVVEVGCGKGRFSPPALQGREKPRSGVRSQLRRPLHRRAGAVRFVREFYDAHQTQYAPDFVCCRHVIEHVQSPLEMLWGGPASDREPG